MYSHLSFKNVFLPLSRGGGSPPIPTLWIHHCTSRPPHIKRFRVDMFVRLLSGMQARILGGRAARGEARLRAVTRRRAMFSCSLLGKSRWRWLVHSADCVE